jgi:hypothetical protein
MASVLISYGLKYLGEQMLHIYCTTEAILVFSC